MIRPSETPDQLKHYEKELLHSHFFSQLPANFLPVRAVFKHSSKMLIEPDNLIGFI